MLLLTFCCIYNKYQLPKVSCGRNSQMVVTMSNNINYRTLACSFLCYMHITIGIQSSKIGLKMLIYRQKDEQMDIQIVVTCFNHNVQRVKPSHWHVKINKLISLLVNQEIKRKHNTYLLPVKFWKFTDITFIENSFDLSNLVLFKDYWQDLSRMY